jgi:EAL domain-containing protein (putative c-di-GMP-specific phosphodiesterase class I)
MGFRLAIDDFGTGYSNLGYLQRYPITSLKIDRSFINMLESPMPIAQIVLVMCEMLNIEVVAEGVETAAQLQWLKDKGCKEYQGYFFSAPVQPDRFLALVHQEKRRDVEAIR